MNDFSFSFGPFLLSPTRRILSRDGKPVRLGSRALDLLVALVDSGKDLISKEDLLKRVWPGTFIEEANLRVHVAALRKLLGDEGTGAQYISTIAGRGYCFVAPVVRIEEFSEVPATRSPIADVVPGLPPSLTRVIGRAECVETITNQLARRRFVNIVGPGGIGKTTVALSVASNLAGSHSNEVCFVELAALTEERAIHGVLASVLGLATLGDQPLPALIAHLRGRSIVIVLDNCEHMLDATAHLAESLLRGAPGVSVLATSRQPLRGEGEFLFHLPALACPPAGMGLSTAEALSFPAVELFAERAAASLDTFNLGDGNVGTVIDICRRLDGIPLAIELAAARVDLFGAEGLASRLNDCFSLLTKGRRTALPRHQTLRATLDWSFELLPEEEKLVLRRLAILAGEFTMESAIAMGSGGQKPADDIVDTITGLIERSLIATDLSGDVPYYRLLGTTRAYALEKLKVSGEETPIALCHSMYFEDLARTAEADWETIPASQWLQIYGRTIDDVRAAIDWALASGEHHAVGFDIIVATAPLWFQLSLMDEYRERLLSALDRLDQGAEIDLLRNARLRISLGHAVWYARNDTDQMEDAFVRALAISEQIGDRSAQLQSLWGMWAVRRSRGQYRDALAIAKRYEGIAVAFGEPKFISLANRILSVNSHYLGRQDVALSLVEQVQSQTPQPIRSANNDFQLDRHVAMTSLLARIRWLQGFPERSVAHAREAISAALGTKHVLSLGYALCMAGCPVALWTGDLPEAKRCTELLREHAASNALYGTWGRCFEHVIRLRQGTETEIIAANYIEARIDVSTISRLADLNAERLHQGLVSDPRSEDTLWSYPDILRVDADLLMKGQPKTGNEVAEAKLLRSLELSRSQSLLSFELRAAVGLAQLWDRTGHRAKARSLVEATHGKFTEGFATMDLLNASRLMSELA